jgi:hypothetical protein
MLAHDHEHAAHRGAGAVLVTQPRQGGVVVIAYEEVRGKHGTAIGEERIVGL